MRKNRLFSMTFIGMLLSLCVFNVSCTNDPTEVDVYKIPFTNLEKTIVVFHEVDSLGDNSYQDDLTYGIHKAAVDKNILVYDLTPKDMDEAKKYLTSLVSSFKEVVKANAEAKINFLFIFTNASYLSMLKTEEVSSFINENVDDRLTYLLFESKETELPYLSTVYMPLYGASYLAALTLERLFWEVDNPRVQVLLGNDSDVSYLEGLEGFALGYGALRETTISYDKIYNYYTSTSNEDANEMKSKDFVVQTICGDSDKLGYYSEDVAYKIASNNPFNHFDLYVPFCRKSANGLFRYNRELNENSFWTVGVESEMSSLTNQVPYSIVKYVAKAVELCISQWFEDGKIPHYQRLGLTEGYTGLELAWLYSESGASVEEGNLVKAKELESKYYEAEN